MKSKKAKIIFSIIVAVLVIACVLPLANSLFGNPISKHLAEKTAIEYIKENYSDNYYIEEIWYDAKYEDYTVRVLSSADKDVDLHLHVNPEGKLTVIDIW